MPPRFRPTEARIDLSAIAHNYHLLAAQAAPARVLVAVKANGYGHGAVHVAKRLESEGCSWLGVATVEEGLHLRSHGVSLPILVFGGPGRTGADAMVAQDLTAAVYDEGSAHRLNAAAARHGRVVPVHIQLDSGMSRLGVLPSGWSAFLDTLSGLEHLHIDGVMTHFARADDSKPATADQVAAFKQCLQEVEHHGHRPTFVHADNSAGALGYRHGFSLVRPGVAIYGLQPGGPERFDALQPAMSLHTEVLHTKWIPKGTPVSYGGTWVAPRRTRLAVLPVGYGDGYPRILSDRASVLIAGQRAPIRGRICMDLLMVDTTDIDGDVVVGTPVVLMGSQGDANITADELAHQAHTINYEVVTSMGIRLPRVWSGA